MCSVSHEYPLVVVALDGGRLVVHIVDMPTKGAVGRRHRARRVQLPSGESLDGERRTAGPPSPQRSSRGAYHSYLALTFDEPEGIGEPDDE